jgi:hypothetical protein
MPTVTVVLIWEIVCIYCRSAGQAGNYHWNLLRQTCTVCGYLNFNLFCRGFLLHCMLCRAIRLIIRYLEPALLTALSSLAAIASVYGRQLVSLVLEWRTDSVARPRENEEPHWAINGSLLHIVSDTSPSQLAERRARYPQGSGFKTQPQSILHASGFLLPLAVWNEAKNFSDISHYIDLIAPFLDLAKASNQSGRLEIWVTQTTSFIELSIDASILLGKTRVKQLSSYL